MSTITTLDIIFYTFTILVVIVATYRGIIKEFFSILNWLIAFLFSYLLSPLLSKYLAVYFDSRLIMDISIRIGIFIISFIAFIFLTSRFIDDLTSSFNIYLNKFLGAVFGFFKSILIFGLLYSFYNCFFDYALGNRLVEKNAKRMPSWYANSRSSVIINFAGNIVDPMVKSFINLLKTNYSDVINANDRIDKKIENKYMHNQLDDADFYNNNNNHLKQTNPNDRIDNEINNDELKMKPNVKIINETGYDKNDIEKMQKLIEIINK